VTEIRLDVELAHPPERVWRAIVDAKLLGEWFLPGGLRPVVGHRFRFEPAGQAGFDDPIDAEVLEADPPRRLAMRWLAPELDARVAITLTRAVGGCQLTLRQSGFFGMQGLLRRRVLHRTYTEMLGRKLPEVLDRLAVEDGRRGPGGAVGAALARRRAQRARAASAASVGRRNTARPFRRISFGRRVRAVGRVRVSRPLSLESTIAISAGALPRGGRRRASRSRGRRERRPEWVRVLTGRFLRTRESLSDGLARVGLFTAATFRRPIDDRDRAVAVGAGMLLALGLVTVIVVAATALYPAGDPQVGGGGGDAGEGGYTHLPGSPRVSDSTSASRTAATQAPPSPSPSEPVTVGGALTAVYRTETSRLGGYTGLVEITNPTAQVVDGWTVVLSVEVLNQVTNVSGAVVRQDGTTVTFTPTPDTRLVNPGQTVRFRFDVEGVGGKPTACNVDGKPCLGVPE
jgi:uncharacterized protein YndB with AHSA1/START domain